MGEETTMLERCKAAAKHRNAKRTAWGGVSVATLLAVYEIFVPQSVFNDHAISEKEARSAQWRALSETEARIKALELDMARVQMQLRWVGRGTNLPSLIGRQP